MSMIQNNMRAKTNQSGMVSIVVTMIIMVLLSLIVLGFAKVSRRELRQGLDRQLASQAKYAAESGINDAQAFLQAGNSPAANSDTVCNSYAAGGLPANKPNTINGEAKVSCVLVDVNTPDLVYDGVDTEHEVAFILKSSTGAAINDMTVAWSPTDGTTDFTPTACPDVTVGADALPSAAGWTCSAGALRVDVVPVTASMSRATMLANLKSTLLVPESGSVGNGADLVHGEQTVTHCPTPPQTPATRACSAKLRNIGPTPANPTASYYVRIRPLYKAANIQVMASQTGGTALDLVGAQAIIDSTGRATDVLKRLVARVPVCAGGIACGKQPAGFALQSSESICKQFGIIPPSTVLNGQDDPDPNCTLQ